MSANAIALDALKKRLSRTPSKTSLKTGLRLNHPAAMLMFSANGKTAANTASFATSGPTPSQLSQH